MAWLLGGFESKPDASHKLWLTHNESVSCPNNQKLYLLDEHL